jgi:hypothetical protein
MTERIYRRGDSDPPVEHDRVDEPETVEELRTYVDRRPAVERETTYIDRPVDAAVTHERVTGMRYYDSLAGRVNAIIIALMLALEALLALRFVLLAFGARQSSSFVNFIMDVSWPFVRPFSGAFSDRTWDQGVIEVNTLLAMGVWFVGFMLLALLINAVIPNIDESSQRVRRERITHM